MKRPFLNLRVRSRLLAAGLLPLLLAACGGGGGGGAAPAPDGPSSAAPDAGVYLDASAPSTQLRPSLVAAVSRASATTPAWTAWDAHANGDTRLYIGTVDVQSASSPVRFFDASSAQVGQADLRSSRSTSLRATVTAMTQPLTLDARAEPADRLLALADLAATQWEGHWRHHGPLAGERGVALDKRLNFAALGAGRQGFAGQSILNCFVDAEVTEQQSGQPGLFQVRLTLTQIPNQASCSHVGQLDGVLVAWRLGGATGRPQLRLAAMDSNQRLAISYVAQ